MRGERAHGSFQATALVHEAYLRLVDTQHVNWHNRAHFLAMAARLMLLLQPASAENFLGEPALAMAPGLIDNPAEPPLTGQTLGAYCILDLVGVGGMGEVYRARDTRLGREVAIKVLPRLFSADPERLARFEREARLLASLNHPHIAQSTGSKRLRAFTRSSWNLSRDRRSPSDCSAGRCRLRRRSGSPVRSPPRSKLRTSEGWCTAISNLRTSR
jgi:hypothetical protein